MTDWITYAPETRFKVDSIGLKIKRWDNTVWIIRKKDIEMIEKNAEVMGRVVLDLMRYCYLDLLLVRLSEISPEWADRLSFWVMVSGGNKS